MKVLFAGATGNVGRHIVPLLKDRFDLRLTALEETELCGLPVIPSDVTRLETLLPLMEGMDAVVNCAIQVRDYARWHENPAAFGEPMDYREGCLAVNAQGAHLLYEAAARAGIRKVVYISSLTIVLGGLLKDPPATLPLRGPDRPMNFYACTKLFGEELGRLYAREAGLSVLCLRLGQIPHPKPEKDLERMRNDLSRGLMVSYGDVARAVACALRTEAVSFGVYPVVSASDSPRVESPAVPEIGYTPGTLFTADGPRELSP